MSSFGALLRQHRLAASLTQEDLATRAQLSPHEISDLEREVTRAPHVQTVQLLADALNLTGSSRADFEAAARLHRASDLPTTGRPPVSRSALAAARRRGDPWAWMSLVVTRLDERGVLAARAAAEQWRKVGPVDGAWLAWVEELIELAAAGRLQATAARPIPAVITGRLLGRDPEVAELSTFLERVKQGRGGLALVLGPAGIGKSSFLCHVLSDGHGANHLEWMTFDRGESGYQGWRRLLAPLWTAVRREELAPASLLAHRAALDDVLLTGDASKLIGRHFSGEVATAVAALLTHVALRQPLVLVIDDAHRGGLSSDQLLIAVARLVNPCGVGLIAAVRPDELAPDSPLRGYDAEDGGRAAVDVVTPIRVPPLDLAATAGLLRERVGSEPPRGIVEKVLRQTGGRPQLIQNIEIQVPPGQALASQSTAWWIVGKLGAAGLRVLDSTIQSRPEATREILQVAAISAGDGTIEPDVVAGLTGQPAGVVEEILDDERRRGVILAPRTPDYRFEHDNWIDALVNNCPAVRRRAIHSRCLELLRNDQRADVRRLARHAIGAGPAMVPAGEIVTLARVAGDLNVADYAFGTAAEFYREAARHAVDEQRIDILIMQADACRPDGRWDEARDALKHAASLARTLALPGREAMALVHLERLTWSYGLRELDLTQQIRDAIERLPADEMILRAQAQAALAMRLSITTRQRENEQADLARELLRKLPTVTGASARVARADMILGIRCGLQDAATPAELLGYDDALLDLGIDLRSAYHTLEALSGRIIDLIRAGRLRELASAMRALREFADQIAAPYAWYALALFDAMFALAHGDFDVVRTQTELAARLSAEWGDSLASEALMGQVGWLLYETGEVEGLGELLADLPTREMGSLNELVWELGAGLIRAERGDVEVAVQALRDVCTATEDLARLPRGPSRSAILATAATLLGHPALLDAIPGADAAQWGRSLMRTLNEHPDAFMLAGWPAVILGSKNRHIGLASLAARQTAQAAAYLTRAADENAQYPVLHARTLFDLARTLLRQPASRMHGAALLDRVSQKAADLRMPALADQALAELNRCS